MLHPSSGPPPTPETPAPTGRLQAALADQRLPALDGLRAVAVFLVIAYHAGLPVSGGLGVSVFFVLSGFLITWLLLGERERSGTVSLRKFYMRRTLRIFPAYYAFVAVSFALDLLAHQRWPRAMLASALTYTLNYYHAFTGTHDGSLAHAWSLAVEEQFYLLWPVLFLLLAAAGPRALRRGLVAIIVAVVAWRSYLYLGRGFPTVYVYNAFDTRLDNLAVGCLLAVLLRQGIGTRPAEAAGRRAAFPLITIAALVVSSELGPTRYHYTIGFTIDAALIALLIVQLMPLVGRGPWRWLEHPAVRYLGALSYPLYLYHGWGLTAGDRLVALPRLLQITAGTLISIALAAGSYHILEQPFLRLKQRFETRRRPLSTGTPSSA